MKYYVGKGTEFKKEECREYKTLRNALAAAAKDEALMVWDENGAVVGGLTDKVPEGALQTNPDGSVNAYDKNGEKTGTISAEEAAAITGETPTDNADKPQTGETGDGQGNELPATENGQDGANTKPHEDTGDGDGGRESAETPTSNAETPTDKPDGVKPEKSTPEGETGQDGANTEPHGGEDTGGDSGQQSEETPEVIIPQGKMKVTVVCDGTLNLRRTPAWESDNICGRASRGQSYYVKAIHTVKGRKMVQTIDNIYLSGESDHVQFEQL